MGGRNDCWWAMLLGDAGSNLRPCCVKVSGHRWLCWLPRDSADPWGYGRWRCGLRTARCDGGVARLLHAEDHLPPRVTARRVTEHPATLDPIDTAVCGRSGTSALFRPVTAQGKADAQRNDCGHQDRRYFLVARSSTRTAATSSAGDHTT